MKTTLAAITTLMLAFASDGGPGTVSGLVTDAQGKPLEGARLWIKPALTTGLVQARTGPDGRYQAEGLLNIPYNTFAWYKMTYRDKTLCMRVAPVAMNQYDSFVPKQGVSRDFKLRISGPIDDRDNVYYGGQIRVFVQDVPRDSAIEVRFEPLGPLADGSTGKTIVRVVKDMMIEDIPVGAYRATARIQEPNGRKRAAQLSRKSFTANVGPDAIVEWESKDSCIGNFGNGLDRIYLYVQ